MKKVVFVYRYNYKDYPIIVEYCTFLEKSGYQVFYIGLTNADEIFQDGQVRVQHIDASKFKNPIQEATSILRILHSIKPNLVHVFQYRGSFLLPLLSNFAYPFLLDVRTVNVGNSKGKYSRFTFLKNRLTWFESLFFKDKIALTGEIKRKLQPNWRPIPVIPLGANRSILNPSNKKDIRQEIRDRYGIKNHEKVLLYCGSLNPNRKVETILQAIKMVLARKTGLYLFIIGNDVNPSSLLNLKQLAAELGISEKVIFTGQLSYGQVVPYYCAADIGLCFIPQTSFFDHQPPTKLFEYMMARLVTIGTKTKAQTDIIQHEVNGFLCEDNASDLGNLIEKILNLEEGILEEISLKCFESMEKYNWDHILGSQLLPVYKYASI